MVWVITFTYVLFNCVSVGYDWFRFKTYNGASSSLRTGHTTAAGSTLQEKKTGINRWNQYPPSGWGSVWVQQHPSEKGGTGTHSSSTAASRASGTKLTSGSSLALLTLRSGGSLRSRVTLKTATEKMQSWTVYMDVFLFRFGEIHKHEQDMNLQALLWDQSLP